MKQAKSGKWYHTHMVYVVHFKREGSLTKTALFPNWKSTIEMIKACLDDGLLFHVSVYLYVDKTRYTFYKVKTEMLRNYIEELIEKSKENAQG